MQPVAQVFATQMGLTVGGIHRIHIEEVGDVGGAEGRPRIELQDAGARQQERPRRERTSARTAGSRSQGTRQREQSGTVATGPASRSLSSSTSLLPCKPSYLIPWLCPTPPTHVHKTREEKSTLKQT